MSGLRIAEIRLHKEQTLQKVSCTARIEKGRSRERGRINRPETLPSAPEGIETLHEEGVVRLRATAPAEKARKDKERANGHRPIGTYRLEKSPRMRHEHQEEQNPTAELHRGRFRQPHAAQLLLQHGLSRALSENQIHLHRITG